MSSNNNEFYLNNLIDNLGANVGSFNSVNIWNSRTELIYEYNGQIYTSHLGNYYSDHDRTDSNRDGITDHPYGLPGDEPDDEYPLAKTSIHYTIE